ncbi:MAG: hypothetical protein R2712_09400 [Vicinamibacterales bacterium]
MLLQGIPELLPKDQVVITLGPDVEADDEVVAACRDLRKAGYQLALDDFSCVPGRVPRAARHLHHAGPHRAHG